MAKIIENGKRADENSAKLPVEPIVLNELALAKSSGTICQPIICKMP